MNKKILGLLICFSSIYSFSSFAENYQSQEYLNILDKKILSSEQALTLQHEDNKGMYDYVDLGDFYIFNNKYRDTFKSFKNYEKAAVRGSEYAKLMVGYMTYKGYGTDMNTFKGIYLLENVKRPYDKNAELLLGKLYLEQGNLEKALPLLENVEDSLSYKMVAEQLIAKNRFKEAIPYLKWLISENQNSKDHNKLYSIFAKRELGSIYFGNEFNNPEKAIELLKSAAKDGDNESQYLLGMYYYKGTKTSKADIHEAVRWFLMASQDNHPFSMQQLLTIWNDNQSNNDLYGLDNDKYLTKKLNDLFVKMAKEEQINN